MRAPRFTILFCSVLWLWFGASGLYAQNLERIPEYEQELYGASAHVTADYQTMKNVRRYWVQEALRLKSIRNYEFALAGNNDAILKVTIPASVLFVAGDTLMSTLSDGYLYPLLHLLRGDEAMASVIISCYSDNNGSDRYLNRVTRARAAVIYRWMCKQGVAPSQISYYGLAKHSARTDNSTLRKREQNRRVSLYFVPNKHMLKVAKKGKL